MNTKDYSFISDVDFKELENFDELNPTEKEIFEVVFHMLILKQEMSVCYYGIEYLNYRQYASLYVPDYTVQRYGSEVVASEALREYGWNGYDDKIVCTDDFRIRVLQELDEMKQKLYLTDADYFDRCRKQFRKAYEGKEVPQWPDTENADGVKDNRSDTPHCIMM